MFTEPVVQGLCMMGLIAFAISRVLCHKQPTTIAKGEYVTVYKYNQIVGWWMWVYNRHSARGLTGEWQWYSNATRKPTEPPPAWRWYKDEYDNEIKVMEVPLSDERARCTAPPRPIPTK
jgi:hypothetical protein